MELPTIPSEFKCAGFTVKIEIHDKLSTNAYGDFDDARNLIRLAKKVEVDNIEVELTEQQIVNSYFHELIHCFQFYFNTNTDEAQAQVFANFICEYHNSIVFTGKCKH